MYYLCNRVGAVVAGDALTWEKLALHWQKVGELGILDAFAYLSSELGSAFLAMMIGGAIIGLILAIPGYAVIQRSIITYKTVSIVAVNIGKAWLKFESM